MSYYHNSGYSWDDAIGKTVKFVYDEINDEIFIKGWKNKKESQLLVEYHGIEFFTKTTNIKNCSLRYIVRNIFAVDVKKELISLIIDDYEKIKNLTIRSEKYVTVKCPYCGTIRKIQVKQLFMLKSISCNKCSDGRSYPEKFVFSFLEQTGIDFDTQVIFNFDKNVRYDFYIHGLNMVIEVDGIQHWDIKNNWYTGNDGYKSDLIENNNMSMIRVIADVSDLEHMKQAIINSELWNIFNCPNHIDWNECHKFACKSIICQVGKTYENGIRDLDELSKIFKLHRKTIREYLKKANELNICSFSIDDLYKERCLKSSKTSKERRSKPISVYKDGELLNTFCSVSDLCEKSIEIFGVQFHRAHVGQVANHQYGRKSCFGYTFEWQ